MDLFIITENVIEMWKQVELISKLYLNFNSLQILHISEAIWRTAFRKSV